MVLTDPSMTEEVRGMHSLHLMRLLTVARPIPPPEEKVAIVTFTQRTGGFVDLTDRVAPPAPVKEKKPKKGKRHGREVKWTDEILSAGLMASDGTVKGTANYLGCVPAVVRNYCKRVGHKPLDGRGRGRKGVPAAGGSDVVWNSANRAKLHEIATRIPRPPLSEIAAVFGTTENAIQTPMSRSGITRAQGRNPTQLTSRDCLNCRTPFMSTHKGNRRCPKCIAEDREVAA